MECCGQSNVRSTWVRFAPTWVPTVYQPLSPVQCQVSRSTRMRPVSSEASRACSMRFSRASGRIGRGGVNGAAPGVVRTGSGVATRTRMTTSGPLPSDGEHQPVGVEGGQHPASLEVPLVLELDCRRSFIFGVGSDFGLQCVLDPLFVL